MIAPTTVAATSALSATQATSETSTRFKLCATVEHDSAQSVSHYSAEVPHRARRVSRRRYTPAVRALDYLPFAVSRRGRNAATATPSHGTSFGLPAESFASAIKPVA